MNIVGLFYLAETFVKYALAILLAGIVFAFIWVTPFIIDDKDDDGY